MKIKTQLDPYAITPTRAHSSDAGLDLYVPENYDMLWLASESSICINTGVHIAIPEGYVGMLKSKSGLNVKHGIVSEGVIDAGYTGSIRAKLYNHGKTGHAILAGDKISQLVILPIITPEIQLVDELEPTERGNNGFGSTGR